MIGRFELCRRRILKVDMSKGKILVFFRDGQLQSSISLNEEGLYFVNEFRYLGVMISKGEALKLC